MKMHLGFDDIPYAARYEERSPLPASVRKRRPRDLSKAQASYGEGKTTGQVAKEIEEKYEVVGVFYLLDGERMIVPVLEDAVADALVAGLEGRQHSVQMPRNDAERIERKFRTNLSQRKYDGVIRGVPTLAALRGISHLRKRPAASTGSRPSFIDTGMYQRTFRVWMED